MRRVFGDAVFVFTNTSRSGPSGALLTVQVPGVGRGPVSTCRGIGRLETDPTWSFYRMSFFLANLHLQSFTGKRFATRTNPMRKRGKSAPTRCVSEGSRETLR